MHTVLLYVRSIAFLLVAFFAMPLMAGQQTLLVVGDSLSAAYGVSSETAWVQLLRERLQGNGAILVGMQIPPNYGQRYTQLFADIFPALSDSYNTALVPFFLDGIYDKANLMQGDGIHPTAEAQPRLLENVWPVLKPLLE